MGKGEHKVKKKRYMKKIEKEILSCKNPTKRGTFKLEDKKAKVLSKKALK